MTNPSDKILADADNVLREARFRRSIGTRSKALKREHYWKKLGRIALATGAIMVGAGIVGAIIGGIGDYGVMLAVVAMVVGVYVFGRYPKMPLPTAANLRTEDLGRLAGRTELWLETQRAALPAPAVQLIDGIGVQLDLLAPQLQTLDPATPAAFEVRKLVGEHLPELVAGYHNVPRHLRGEERGGRTPDQQLVEGLGVIRQEIASVTQQLAQGEIDKLAVKSRFLEIKYRGQDDMLGIADAGDSARRN